jgi:hypothetical protein
MSIVGVSRLRKLVRGNADELISVLGVIGDDVVLHFVVVTKPKDTERALMGVVGHVGHTVN